MKVYDVLGFPLHAGERLEIRAPEPDRGGRTNMTITLYDNKNTKHQFILSAAHFDLARQIQSGTELRRLLIKELDDEPLDTDVGRGSAHVTGDASRDVRAGTVELCPSTRPGVDHGAEFRPSDERADEQLRDGGGQLMDRTPWGWRIFDSSTLADPALPAALAGYTRYRMASTDARNPKMGTVRLVGADDKGSEHHVGWGWLLVAPKPNDGLQRAVVQFPLTSPWGDLYYGWNGQAAGEATPTFTEVDV